MLVPVAAPCYMWTKVQGESPGGSGVNFVAPSSRRSQDLFEAIWFSWDFLDGGTKKLIIQRHSGFRRPIEWSRWRSPSDSMKLRPRQSHKGQKFTQCVSSISGILGQNLSQRQKQALEGFTDMTSYTNVWAQVDQQSGNQQAFNQFDVDRQSLSESVSCEHARINQNEIAKRKRIPHFNFQGPTFISSFLCGDRSANRNSTQEKQGNSRAMDAEFVQIEPRTPGNSLTKGADRNDGYQAPQLAQKLDKKTSAGPMVGPRNQNALSIGSKLNDANAFARHYQAPQICNRKVPPHLSDGQASRVICGAGNQPGCALQRVTQG
ncbi:hypothetical protein K438DRAFT_2130618 [Mycena galopus ATCC 62051]|nr:hypothetical protein K438DRAFT_2130618 [Mycena galopus ATCC 62051]